MEAIVLAATLLFGAPPDPYRLYSPNKSFYAKEIVQAAANSPIPPAEALAIALTESNLNPRAYSRTKDVGLFQVNCKWWYKKFKYASIKKCEKALLDPFKNIEAGLFILAYFRKNFKQCRKELAFRCYNGGQRWQRSKNKKKIINYARSVARRKKNIEKYYRLYIYTYTREVTYKWTN